MARDQQLDNLCVGDDQLALGSFFWGRGGIPSHLCITTPGTLVLSGLPSHSTQRVRCDFSFAVDWAQKHI